ncbi:MAG TPA: M13 family metallopeptidase [Anaeromyxobacter sp.]|nr:M13 family metallopeptidase [Anaeromyxobacter sp.]
MRHPAPLTPLALAAALAACAKAPPRTAPEDAPPPPIDAAALDRGTSPCDDFFQFACGGWLAATEIPADRAYWHRGFVELEERNARQLRRLLDAAAAGKVDPADRFSDKLGAFWASCMDENAVDARGLAELRAEWARIDAIHDRQALADELARLHASGVQAPFPMYADQDARDATQVILNVVQGGLSLPDRDFYLTDDGKNPEIRRDFSAHLRRMLALAGLPPARVEADAAAVETMERALAETHWTRTEERDPARVYNRVDRAGLEELAPAFPWARFFANLGHPGLLTVNVTTPRFVERAGRLFETGDLEGWKAYLRWHLLDDMATARALPKELVEERFQFQARSFTGAKALLPRWKHCVRMADQALGFALGQAYVRRHFGPGGKDRTTRLVAEISRAMERDVEQLAWMDGATRARAREKISTLVNKVGYPDAWRDYAPMKVSRDSYFKNVLAAARYETNRQLDKVGRPLDRSEWFMSPPTVNAYYNPAMNEMVFPAGILQPPFFNEAAPEPVNYGAIGMVVGHELTHGFDDQGRKYDARGNLADWWTPEAAREFDRRAACVVRQYAGYESVPGVRLNGELTLGENIADLGGLKLAHAAMRAALEGREAPPAVEGFGVDQQFFVGFAQSWCAKYREENLRLRAVTDPHSPARYRVNGPLANLPEFAKAFRCAEGSPMVRPPQDRCEVW